jgi:hypothetical protein
MVASIEVVGCVAATKNLTKNDTESIAVTHRKCHGQSECGSGTFWPCSHILNIESRSQPKHTPPPHPSDRPQTTTNAMQIKDLTIDEFRQLIKTCIRETVEEIIDDRLDDDPDTILPELRQTLLQQRDRRQTGQTKTLSAAEALQALDLDDE